MRILFFISLLIWAVRVDAVPARRTVFKAKMADGTYQNIRLCGDEWRSYYLNEDGFIVEPDASGTFYVQTWKRPEDEDMTGYVMRRGGIGLQETAPIKSVGSPKIPVILVNFSDVKMTLADTDEEINAYYGKYCNGTFDGNLYTGAGSHGSVRDYFAQQSDSLFLPDFVVIGPVTLSKEMAYYGQNSGSRKDIHFTEFCSEALSLALELSPNLATDFDNDGNGTIDMAFYIFAGLPESDSGVTSDAIWPKELVSPTTVNGVTISVMACCSELSKSGTGSKPSGIGTMCHEVSHALGLPDQYDVNMKELGMSYWSLMDSGNYCGNGCSPCGMTGYERDFLGWRALQPITESCTVRLRPLESGGSACKVTNDANPDEYYVLENRYTTGWDEALANLGHGMLVVHVDYDKAAWSSNRLNTNGSHQRMSFIPANNAYIGPYNAGTANVLVNALSGQPYPGATGNTSLTDDSEPASTVFTGGFMGKPITQIREMENGDIVFKFMPKGTLSIPESLVGKDMTEDAFTLEWQETADAECYAVEVYGVSGEGEVTDDLLFAADSVSASSCFVQLAPVAYDKLACRVMAMADCYEDSGFSEFCHISLPASAIGEVRGGAANEDEEVYSIHGIRLGRSKDILNTLPEGIYILRTEKASKKIVIH